MEEQQQHDGKSLREQGEKWTDRIRKAHTREDSWTKDATAAEKAYAVDDKASQGKCYDFNILHSNVETIVPAIYNSTPSPDIRRRFADKDPVAKEFAEMLERALSIQIDDNRLDTEIESSAQDAFVAGRGIVRIVFNADDDEETGSVSNERVMYEAVSWRDFRMGKAKRWSDVPWVAFKHSIDREEIERITNVDMYASQFPESEKPLLTEGDDDIDIWEIWDKSSRTVLLIRDDDGAILKQEEDPLGLKEFFPMPMPVQPISVTSKMTPVCPFTIYMKLADELDTLTKRIIKIVKGIKVKGLLAGVSSDMANLADADDNELIIAQELEQIAMTGGLDKAITWWPIEPAIKAVVALHQQREATKQAIYEITGISDIVRGASNASETATAQNLKSQWGSLRIQKMQKLIQRQCRDLFVITAEIITTKFSEQTLQDMTGVQLTMTPEEEAILSGQIPKPNEPQQLEQWQQMEQAAKSKQSLLEMLNKPVLTAYRVDIESDSTIRADMTRMRGETSEFLQATGAFFAAMSPVVASAPALGQPVAEIYAAFARNYNLGKQAEDAIETMSEMAQQASKQATQQQQQPSPEQETAKIKLEQEQVKLESDKVKLQGEKTKLMGDQEERQVVIDENGQRQPTPTEQLVAQMGQVAQMLAQVAQSQSMPKEIVYDDYGKVVGVKPAAQTMN